MGKGERLTKENVIETTRTWFMTRETVVSTLLGLLVVVGMRITDNVWSVLGLIALVFINYYLLMGRKRKLSILGSGSLMYYTEDLDRQVIRIRHYDHGKIKGHLFNFGVLNIIYLELIGIVMNSEVEFIGENTVWVKALVTILVYIIAFNYTNKKHSELVDEELKKQIETNNKGVLITLTPTEKEEVATYYGLTIGNRNSSVEQDTQGIEPIKEPIKEETLVDVIAEDMVEEEAEELVEDLLKEEIKEELTTEKDIQEKLVPVLEQVAHKKETEMENKDIVTVKPYNERESEIVSYDWDVKEEDTQEVEEENNQEVEEGNNKVEEDNNQEDIMVRPTEYTSKVIESKLLAYKEENKEENKDGYEEDRTEDKDEDTSNEEGITVDFLDDIHVISDVKTMTLTNGYYKKR